MALTFRQHFLSVLIYSYNSGFYLVELVEVALSHPDTGNLAETDFT